ncbi:MAG: alpha/beta hydrolase [Myxococcales bacterium]|nr:alpha/beta hydrolase [Myxococcales bacterium]
MDTTRREMLQGLGVAMGGVLAGPGVATAVASEPAAAQAAATKRPWWDLGVIGDPIKENQLLWYLGQAGQGLTDVGECLDTASRISNREDDTWMHEWLKTAERVQSVAERSLAAGHRVSAGDAFLRAANYYRAALIHHVGSGEVVLAACRASIHCHEKAIELLSLPAQAVSIPYEDTVLPGHFHRSPVAGRKAPIIVMHQGMHAWPEETRWVTDGGLRRGYHVLGFHGPGQGLPLRRQGLPFRPDWEKVVTPAVDFALEQPGVDRDRVVLMGLSFGGALSPRAAAFEKRIQVCVPNPGVLNWSESFFAAMEHFSPGLVQLLDADPAGFDAAVSEAVKGDALLSWGIRDLMWKYGGSSPSVAMGNVRKYNNEETVDQISCDMLIMDGTAEEYSVGQAKRLYDAVGSPKEYLLFTAEDTGLVHCQAGATAVAAQRLFDALDPRVL